MDAETKTCPHCAETIKSAALRCPYCQKSQTRWVSLKSDLAWMLFAFALLIGGFILVAYLLTAERDFSAHRDEITVLTSQMTEAVTYSTSKDLIVFGILTNQGSYKWEVGRFEVRFLDKNGKLMDVASETESFTLLPHSEHAYRLSFDRRRLDPLYSEAKVYVRAAKDPKNL